jgi:hypothetical protein
VLEKGQKMAFMEKFSSTDDEGDRTGGERDFERSRIHRFGDHDQDLPFRQEGSLVNIVPRRRSEIQGSRRTDADAPSAAFAIDIAEAQFPLVIVAFDGLGGTDGGAVATIGLPLRSRSPLVLTQIRLIGDGLAIVVKGHHSLNIPKNLRHGLDLRIVNSSSSADLFFAGTEPDDKIDRELDRSISPYQPDLELPETSFDPVEIIGFCCEEFEKRFVQKVRGTLQFFGSTDDQEAIADGALGFVIFRQFIGQGPQFIEQGDCRDLLPQWITGAPEVIVDFGCHDLCMSRGSVGDEELPFRRFFRNDGDGFR